MQCHMSFHLNDLVAFAWFLFKCPYRQLLYVLTAPPSPSSLLNSLSSEKQGFSDLESKGCRQSDLRIVDCGHFYVESFLLESLLKGSNY